MNKLSDESEKEIHNFDDEDSYLNDKKETTQYLIASRLRNPCEVCGKSDLETTVVCSSFGAMSMNYCLACRSLGAEPKILVIGAEAENIIEKGEVSYYNKETDTYQNTIKGDLDVKLTTEFGKTFIFKTRNQIAEFFRYQNIAFKK